MVLLQNAFDYFAENTVLKNSIVLHAESFVTNNISTLTLLSFRYDVYIRNKCIHYSPLLVRGSVNWNCTSCEVGKYIVAINLFFLKWFMIWASIIFVILFTFLSALFGYLSSSFGVPAILYCNAHIIAFLAPVGRICKNCNVYESSV
jgi:hypothetical protein